MTFYIPIQGTSAWDENPDVFQWWEMGSRYYGFLRDRGYEHASRTPFEWSTELAGILDRAKTVWKAGGKSLGYYFGEHLAPMPYEHRNVVAHSHGGQLVFYAAASGVRIRNLITVGTPVRADMEATVRAARVNIKNWVHLMDTRYDIVSVLGAIGDGKLRIKHDFKEADKCFDLRDIKAHHSHVLSNPQFYPYWMTRGWAQELSRE